MSNYSTFKVIKIIDEYSIVINGGVNEDLSIGEEVEIFVKGEEIKDPFNDNRVLGTLDYIKERLEITEIYREFAVCEKFVEKEIYHPSAMERAMQPTLGVFAKFSSGRKETIREKVAFKVEESEVSGRVRESSPIKIGDLARVAISE